MTWRVEPAAARLRAGGVVAYPTEAVFGLGCDPLDGRAVERVLRIKRRPMHKGLIVIADDARRFEGWLAPTSRAEHARLVGSWPGPITWLVAAQAWVPHWLTGGTGRLAVRVTAHPVARALARAFAGPIVSTSANHAGAPPARTALDVRLRLGRLVDAVQPGRVAGAGGPSEIRDLASGRVVRPGAGGAR